MRIGIIGGGAAGLAAAYELAGQGHFAEVFEVAPFLGGQASTFDIGGGRLERGYHHLFVSDTAITDLIHELGLGEKLAWLESRVGIFHSGQIWDFATPMDLLKFRPLSLTQRIRLGLLTFVLQKTRNWQKFEGVTAQDWLTHNLGKDIYQAIWEPMLRGKFGEHYDRISMTWLWGKIYLRVASRGKTLQKERLGYPMGSFGEIFERLEEEVVRLGGQVHLSARVNRVVVEEGVASGLEVQLEGQEPARIDYDAIIATTPSYVFVRLVPPLPQDYHQKLVGTQYLSAVLVILALDRPLTSKYWLNVADRSLPFVGVIEHTNMIDPSLYGGNHIVYLTNYTPRDSDLYARTSEQLLDDFIPHLRKVNPQFDRSWIREYYHHKVDGAQPIIGVNYGDSIPDHRTPIQNLYLANTTQIYPEDRGTNYSVKMGREVARMVMEDLGSG